MSKVSYTLFTLVLEAGLGGFYYMVKPFDSAPYWMYPAIFIGMGFFALLWIIRMMGKPAQIVTENNITYTHEHLPGNYTADLAQYNGYSAPQSMHSDNSSQSQQYVAPTPTYNYQTPTTPLPTYVSPPAVDLNTSIWSGKRQTGLNQWTDSFGRNYDCMGSEIKKKP